MTATAADLASSRKAKNEVRKARFLSGGPSIPKNEEPPSRTRSRQCSEPARNVSDFLNDFEDLDPRVKALCRQITEGVAHMPIPPAPSMFALPPLPGIRQSSGDGSVDFNSEDGGVASNRPLLEAEDDESTVKCLLAPEDQFSLLANCCFMGLAQGSTMCSFYGAIGYFSRQMGSPQLILYTTIAQAILTPVVLDLQRRYDHVFDARLGHKFTILFRIVGLSMLQVLLVLLIPFMTSPLLFLILACVSGAITVMVFAQVCMVISCTDGTQAVNFARTACHSGGIVVLCLSMAWGVSTQSNFSEIVGFFACVAALQAAAVVAWYLEHRRNKSLYAAYAIIAAQQSYAAEEARKARDAAAEDGVAAADKEAPPSYTLVTMFGSRHSSTGMVLLGSFSIIWVAWSCIQSTMNMFGDEDLTQWLVLLSYPADTAGRLFSHFIHGCSWFKGATAPAGMCHALTSVALVMSVVLLADTSLRFLGTAALGVVVFSLCFITTFNMNELAVKTMELAKSRVQLAHCQNYVFFAATGVAKFLALFFQFVCGSA